MRIKLKIMTTYSVSYSDAESQPSNTESRTSYGQ